MTARPGELTLEMKRVLSATRSVVFGDFSGPEGLTNRFSTSSGSGSSELSFRGPRRGDGGPARLRRDRLLHGVNARAFYGMRSRPGFTSTPTS